MKRGIIQSRGLGDILIALPIAHFYHLQGDEIVWPICEEFYSSVSKHVPWVQWVSIPTDDRGAYFLETPLSVFKEKGIATENVFYMYQYLNSMPELTDPEFFSILKFDQYKYQVAGVPFRLKWALREVVTRDPVRERALWDRINIKDGERYCVAHLTGSSARVDQNLVTSVIDPAVRVINVDDYLTDSIFDWLGVLEKAESIVCLDSAMANLVDQWCIQGPALFWIRRSGWDLTPVLGSAWTIIPTNLPVKDPVRVDPKAQAEEKVRKLQAAQEQQQASLAAKAAASAVPQQPGDGTLVSHVPFKTDSSKIPKDFMFALKK